jgi:hypothetical protein
MTAGKSFKGPLKLRYLALGTILSACFVSVAEAQLIQNGGFEITTLTPNIQPGYHHLALGPGNTDITGWVTTHGYNPAAPAGVIQYISGPQIGARVELGTYQTLAGIQQTFATVPNRSYTISFSLASNPINPHLGSAKLRVSAGGSFADYTAPAPTGNELDLGWQLKQFNFIADNTGMTTLQFGNLQGLPAIDNVSVVPEPQCLTLLGLSGGSLFTSAFRRRIKP